MNNCRALGFLAVSVISGVPTLSGADTAIELYMDDDLQQIRIEAQDVPSGRWLAVASGYREHADNGWLRIALPKAYADADLRVIGSSRPSPFAGKIRTSVSPEADFVAYPPMRYDLWSAFQEDAVGKGEPVIEEADIWAWRDSTLYFYNQYRGLQVIDCSAPMDPHWVTHYRYPAKGEDLYLMEDGTVILIGTGHLWNDQKVSLQFLDFNGEALTLRESLPLESGQYLDSRRYGDFLYIMTREWVVDQPNDHGESLSPLVRLYTVSLNAAEDQRVKDVQTFQGHGWLDAVLTAQPDGILISLNQWASSETDRRGKWYSEVHVLVPDEEGIPRQAGVATVSGAIRDKFKMRYSKGLLTTLSQETDWATGQFTPVTKFENFLLGEGKFEKSGELDLAPGETLFATRFHGDTVYVVTFLLIDPLYAIDNTDPAHPVIAGELEVPGWSDYLEWVDDHLFAIGAEEGRVTVSIFDVADPRNMSLKDRVFLGNDSWTTSEAQYDDQAVSIFPERKLLMLPFISWSWTSGGPVRAMQLVSWDETGLQLRGAIHHTDTPRRGYLLEDTVVTISGQEVVTTTIANPDIPVAGGKATVAWNVNKLIRHEDYLIQLETHDSLGDFWGWRMPYNPVQAADPILYVTSLLDPNRPIGEVPLEAGRLLGAGEEDGILFLLQDLSSHSDTAYGEVPDMQSLAVRAYDLSDPTAPVLLDEHILTEAAYLGGHFKVHAFGDHLLWTSVGSSTMSRYCLDAIGPWPWFSSSDLAYMVTRFDRSTGALSVPAFKTFTTSRTWDQASEWHWKPPYLVGSLTEFIEGERPETPWAYTSSTELVAIDLSNPGEPMELPGTKLPGKLAGIHALPDRENFTLYFEPFYNRLEVWGWDGATAFKLFDQELFPSNMPVADSYSHVWMAPFHVRARHAHTAGQTSSFLEIWQHELQDNRFSKIADFSFSNDGLGGHAVLDDLFLQSSQKAIHLFRADAQGGTFERLEILSLAFPDLAYTLNLRETLLTDEQMLIPAGLYGVEVIPREQKVIEGTSPLGFRQLAGTSNWVLLNKTRWSQVSLDSTPGAGAIRSLKWLYRSDALRELDAGAVDGGDLWRGSSWFGWYAHRMRDPAWIDHIEHGLLYTYVGLEPQVDGFYFLDPEWGAMWTHSDIYPWLYAYSKREWTYYLTQSGLEGRRWFYGLNSGWFRDE